MVSGGHPYAATGDCNLKITITDTDGTVKSVAHLGKVPLLATGVPVVVSLSAVSRSIQQFLETRLVGERRQCRIVIQLFAILESGGQRRTKRLDGALGAVLSLVPLV